MLTPRSSDEGFFIFTKIMAAASKKRIVWILVLLGLGLAAAMFIAVAFGTVNISPPDIVHMLLNKTRLFHFPVGWRGVDETIIFDIRLPRVIGGVLAGAALAVAGVLFQGMLRNPLADPYVTGTSAGAALGTTAAMILPVEVAFLGFGLTSIAAFAGALVTVLIVYRMARVGGKTPIVSMLLAGFAVSAMLTAVITFLMSTGDRLGLNLRSVFSFLMGHISVTDWAQLGVVAPLVIGGVITSFFLAFRLNVFALGEEGASYLGIDVEKNKIWMISLASLLTAAAVSISGLIGFVGLVMPHAVRLTLGPDHRLLVPASAIGGAIFLVVADLLSRIVLSPGEIPVGIITAVIGAPFFLYLLRRSRKEYGL